MRTEQQNNIENILNRIENEANKGYDRVREVMYGLPIFLDIPERAPKRVDGFDPDAVIETPDGQLIYDNKGNFLGRTGARYESLQPKDFLAMIVNAVETCEVDLDLSKMNARRRNKGRIVELRIPTGIHRFTNAAGNEDETEIFISFETGAGGVARTRGGVYTHRFICSNGMMLSAGGQETLLAKHTTRKNIEALAWCDELLRVMEEVKTHRERVEALDKIKVSKQRVQAFAQKLVGVDPKKGITSKRQEGRLEAVRESIAVEFQRTGATAWGLLNGATYYTNHVAGFTGDGERKEGFILDAQGRKTNDLAQELVYALV